MYSDTEFAQYFRNWTEDGHNVNNESPTKDLFERVWSQAQAFQEGSLTSITATTVAMIDCIARNHSLFINYTDMCEMIHHHIQNMKSLIGDNE